MKMYLTLYSESLKNNAEALSEAIKCRALIKNAFGDPELLISHASNRLLDLFIQGHVSGVKAEQYEEKIAPLDGGLRVEGKDGVIEHQCCSEFDDYMTWEFILDKQATHWTEIWIGHPWIYYRIDGRWVYLSDYCEDIPGSLDFRFAFDKDHFLSTLRIRVNEAHRFKQRIQKVIQRGAFLNKEVLINRLIHI